MATPRHAAGHMPDLHATTGTDDTPAPQTDESTPPAFIPADTGGTTAREDRGNGYLLPGWLYQTLKWAGLALLPLLAAFVGMVGPLWGWPDVDETVATLNALGVLVAGLIGISSAAPAATGHLNGK